MELGMARMGDVFPRKKRAVEKAEARIGSERGDRMLGLEISWVER